MTNLLATTIQGRDDEAYKLYMTLERHPAAEIQKGAKRMLFGFRYFTSCAFGIHIKSYIVKSDAIGIALFASPHLCQHLRGTILKAKKVLVDCSVMVSERPQ